MQILGGVDPGVSVPQNAPTSLSAIPTNISVAISFTAPTNDGGSPITNYEYSFNNSSWTALSPADATSPVTVSGLTQNTTYTVYLRAVNIVGVGPGSTGVSFTTEGVPTGTPTITSVPVGTTTATVNFTYPGGGGAVTGYDLYVTNFTNSWNNTTASPISVTGLTPNTTYTFFVRAKNAYGVGPQSDGVNATTLAVYSVEYLVIAGGGGGGYQWAGGGGAGGYRTSVSGATNGGGGGAESALSITQGTGVTVTVGAGGGTGGGNGGQGSNSVFSSITSTGGGFGATNGNAGGGGGSGGGGGAANGTGQQYGGGARTASPVQGFNGGPGEPNFSNGFWSAGGGGSGAGQAGTASGSYNGGQGGAGLSSSITTAAVTRAGGGSGGTYVGAGGGLGKAGGAGGGGQGGGYNGSVYFAGVAGAGNTGSGGGGGYGEIFQSPNGGGAGGSGVVIIRYLSSLPNISVGGGLSFSGPSVAGGYKIYTFTGGTGTVTF
jgi:hypothetical protein